MGTNLNSKTAESDTDFSLAVADWKSLLPQGFLQATAERAENLAQRAEGLAQEVLRWIQKTGLTVRTTERASFPTSV